MEDLSSSKFPKIPRANENVQGGWQGYVNKLGREGSDPIIKEAFSVNLARDEVNADEGPQQRDELGTRPECG
jgi:hypothetical protein